MPESSPPASRADHRRACLAAMAHGDKAAFATLFRDLAPKLRAYFRRCGHTTDADELTQETLLRVWKQAGRYDPQRASPATWIFTIARNLRIDRARKKRVEVVDSDPARVSDPDPTPDEVVSRQQRAKTVREAVKQLPSEQAAVVHDVYFAHKTARAVAEERGLPVGTVKSRIRLAVRALRGTLDLDGEGA